MANGIMKKEIILSQKNKLPIELSEKLKDCQKY
jgi:hypothetical protein